MGPQSYQFRIVVFPGEHAIFGERKRLRRPGRPHQAWYMVWNIWNVIFAKIKALAAADKTSPRLIHVMKSQQRHFCRKKSARGSLEDLTKPNTFHKILRESFLQRTKKAPAAARKTSTELIHLIESQERQFCRKKKAPAAARKISTELIHVIKSQERSFATTPSSHI